MSQYVEYWLYREIEKMILNLWSMCEDRNKSQRENLKEKYSILEKDELLEKIACLKSKVIRLENPEKVEKWKEEAKRLSKKHNKEIKMVELDC